MSSILNNVSALGASRQLGITGTGLQRAIQRLTTGKRINRASDDAAGLGISNKLSADIKVAAQAKRNANDGVSYLQTADGVLDEVTNLLTRASELAEQAKTGTISDANRTNIDAEFQNILKTIIDIGQNTKFNGAAVFTSAALTVSAGGFSPVAVTAGAISSSTTSALGLGTNGATTTTTTSSNPVTTYGAGSNAGLAFLGLSVNTIYDGGYYAAYFMAANSSTPASIAIHLAGARTDWLAGLVDPLIKANFAKDELTAFVAANPTNADGIATLAAVTAMLDDPPAPRSGAVDSVYTTQKAAMDLAVANSSYTYMATTTTTTTTPGAAGDSLTTASSATSAAAKIAAALNSVSSVRATLGASMQQLTAVSNALGIEVENFTSANSQIQDANIADEVVNLTKFQILNQSGTSALSKANQAAQGILALLQ